MLHRDSKIYVAGHQGMVGSAIVRRLAASGFSNVFGRTRSELDLTNQAAVFNFFKTEKPDCVVLAAAKVGGIHANNEYPAEFMYENLIIEANVIHGAFKSGVQSLLFLGSSCIYPKLAEQPMQESDLMSGPLEPTNEPYAIAKIAGIKLCESYNRQYQVDYRSVMPSNLYGINDNFHAENSHVIPALIRKFHEARVSGAPQVSIWGTGRARREFLHVDDMASACLHVLNLDKTEYSKVTTPMLSHLNVGSGKDVAIAELAHLLKSIISYRGELVFDSSKPDGAPRKLMDTSKLANLGWRPEIDLAKGLAETYDWFVENRGNFRR